MTTTCRFPTTCSTTRWWFTPSTTPRDPEAVLRETWRVLVPGGRILVVIPNRRGLWARSEISPFGYGRPFSRRQIEALLRDCQFEPCGSDEALFMPPTRSRLLLRGARTWEGIGRRLWPAFAGLLFVEAEKQVHRGSLVREERVTRSFRPLFIPEGATTGLSGQRLGKRVTQSVSVSGETGPARRSGSTPTTAR